MILLGEKGDPGPPGPTGTNGTNGGTGYFISCSTVKTSNSFHQLFFLCPRHYPNYSQIFISFKVVLRN